MSNQCPSLMYTLFVTCPYNLQTFGGDIFDNMTKTKLFKI